MNAFSKYHPNKYFIFTFYFINLNDWFLNSVVAGFKGRLGSAKVIVMWSYQIIFERPLAGRYSTFSTTCYHENTITTILHIGGMYRWISMA